MRIHNIYSCRKISVEQIWWGKVSSPAGWDHWSKKKIDRLEQPIVCDLVQRNNGYRNAHQQRQDIESCAKQTFFISRHVNQRGAWLFARKQWSDRDNKNVQKVIRHSGKVDQAWIIILTNPVISMNMIGLERSKAKKTSKKQSQTKKRKTSLFNNPQLAL